MDRSRLKIKKKDFNGLKNLWLNLLKVYIEMIIIWKFTAILLKNYKNMKIKKIQNLTKIWIFKF